MDGSDFVTVVSGLPRSGTSMMMKMLEAGGVPPLIDRLRIPDDDNPGGYYEFERVKALPDDSAWVPGAMGKAVKVIYKLVTALPDDMPYRVVFMARQISEVMVSQNKMLSRSGVAVSDAETAVFAEMFKTDLAEFKSWVARQPNIRIHYVDYRQVLEDTRTASIAISEFLGRDLDVDAMAAIVNPDLYRNRA